MRFAVQGRYSGAVLLLFLALAPAGTWAARPAAPLLAPSAQAWLMVGHDPQRTARSASIGPLHPRLLWAYRGVYGPPLISRDGSVYGWGKAGLIALTAAGQRRWTIPAQEFLGGPAALGPDGALRVNGELPAASGKLPAASEPHMSIFALSARGQRLWAIRALAWATVPQSVPFSKGEAPLVTAANLLYVPLVGPVYRPGENNGVEVVSAAGAPLRRLLPGWSGTIAVGHDGSLYEVGGDSQGHNALLAARADGAPQWSHPAAYDWWGDVLIGQQGTVYASDGTGLGRGDIGEVMAYTPAGRLRWRVQFHGGVAALAERDDGIILVATGTVLTALNAHGTRLWRLALGSPLRNIETPPALAVDAVGHLYVGTGDGDVRIVAPNGTLLGRFSTGGPSRDGSVPALALGPAGDLAVTGTDGVLRLYR